MAGAAETGTGKRADLSIVSASYDASSILQDASRQIFFALMRIDRIASLGVRANLSAKRGALE